MLTADSPASASRLILNSKNTRGVIEEQSQKTEDNSEYSEFVAPNAAPSEATRIPVGGQMVVEQRKLGWFKRQCFKLDTHVLKPFLVYKYTTESVEAMNEIDAFMDE